MYPILSQIAEQLLIKIVERKHDKIWIPFYGMLESEFLFYERKIFQTVRS